MTDYQDFEGHGHSLTIEDGWEEIAEATLAWLDDRDS